MRTKVLFVNGFNMNFCSLCAPRITEERKRLKLAQEQAATACGISREMWGKYERAKAAMGGEVLFLFAQAGADVQYVLTGIRSNSATAPDEQMLLDGYRALEATTKRRVLAFMLGGDPLPNQAGALIAKQEQVFNDKVGQALKVEGNLDQTGISFFGNPKKKK